MSELERDIALHFKRNYNQLEAPVRFWTITLCVCAAGAWAHTVWFRAYVLLSVAWLHAMAPGPAETRRVGM